MTGRTGRAGRKISRRAAITGAAAAGGGLALAIDLDGGVALAQQKAPDPKAAAPVQLAAANELGAWVVVRPNDQVVVRVARSEMGQGTITGLVQLVAEELGCDWAKVSYEYPTPGQNHARKRAWGDMSTGGSRGIRTSEQVVRLGGAAARMMLLQAAADQWKVPVGELAVDKGVIRHAASRQTTTYGRVAVAAAKLPVPDTKSIKLKDPKEWTIAGKPLKRLDTADKLNGAKVYAIDVKLPGLLNAAVKACPVFGGKLVSFDEAKAKAMPGVKHVLKVNERTVAVVADTWWHAKKALDALPIVWDEGPSKGESDATIAARLGEGLLAPGDYARNANGDAIAGLGNSAKRVEAVYRTPFLAHACMEPMNCVARWTPERAEVWVPTQNGEASHAALAEAAGLPLDRCEVWKHDLGGGFGRRGGSQDYVRQAVAIARQVPGVPIKMIWSREEDMAQDFYRPISQCRAEAGLDEKGNLVALKLRISGQSINAFVNPNNVRDGKDLRQLQGLTAEPSDAYIGYTVPNLLIEYAMRNSSVPVGPWRGVNTNQNAVYLECIIDEAAKAAGRDPLEFRRALMQKHPKHLAVLEAAAAKAGWGTPTPDGIFRGLAQFKGYGSYSAAVAEVSLSDRGKVRVHRLVLALDSGHVVNPGQVEAQVEGSVAYGLSATFYGENTVKDGRMQELNFDTYQLLKIDEMPKVETVLAPSGGFWGGVGEPTICVVAPAVMNAVAAATGKPVRALPLKNEKLRA